MAKGKGARVKWGSEDSSPAHSSADDDGDDYIREASEDMSNEDSEKNVAFGLESDSEESPTKRGAKKRKGENQKARVPKKKRESEDLTMVLQMLKEQQVETSKISKGFAELTSEVDTMRAARDLKTSKVRTEKTRKQINEDSESDDNKEKETNIAFINNKSVNDKNQTDKGAPKDNNNNQDLLPFIKAYAKGESTPIESAETEHEKKGGEETKEAATAEEVTANGDMKNALVAVCEKDKEKHVAALSEHQMSLEKEWSWADLTEEEKEDHKQNLLSVCTNDEERDVACLSEPDMQKKAQEKLKAKEYDAGMKIMQTWLQLHTRLAILVEEKSKKQFEFCCY